MPPFAYTLRATFTQTDLIEPWLSWLRDEHIAEVLAAGAKAAEIVRLDGAAVVYEVRYRFASREAFAAYERDHAPRLRADGLRRFPVGQGLHYQRSTGEVVLAAPAPGG
jgi:hypothetical protein